MYHFRISLVLSSKAARLGQAYSKTVPTVVVEPYDLQPMPDIKNDKYTFTDGCGQVSLDYLSRVAEHLGLPEPPSAIQVIKSFFLLLVRNLSDSYIIQVRLGGLKGMLALNPHLSSRVLYAYPSMEKFVIEKPSESQRTIEVIKYSVALRACLNRQFITLLHGLGIPTEVRYTFFSLRVALVLICFFQYFLKLQEKYIDQLLNIHTSKERAQSFLAFSSPSKVEDEVFSYCLFCSYPY